MAKQTLGVFTENELDRNYMCKILSQVFSSSLDIVPVTLATVHTLAAEPAAILVNITSLAYADKYFPNSQIIFARRFFGQQSLTSAFGTARRYASAGCKQAQTDCGGFGRKPATARDQSSELYPLLARL
ncbi:hypothetical protein [Flavonifractor plautii]|uniref:hypothetical protein n=1 Tax=Flavonifractor plautii TaxID=292800 RepID=UPI0036F3DB5A